jgi:hypothetical protein
VLIVVGEEDATAYKEAQRIRRSFAGFRGGSGRQEAYLSLSTPDTSLQGTRLLGGRGLDVQGRISRFINRRLVEKSEQFRWKDRTNPLAPR